MQNDKKYGRRDPPCDDIDGIVCLDIDGGKAHQHVEGHHTPEERFASCLPRQEHQDGGDAHMTAGEGGGRTFTGIVGTLHQGVEESVAPSWRGHSFHVGGEVVADVGEHPVGDILYVCCQIVVLRTSDRQEDKDHVVDKKRCKNNKRCQFELGISLEVIEYCHYGY